MMLSFNSLRDGTIRLVGVCMSFFVFHFHYSVPYFFMFSLFFLDHLISVPQILEEIRSSVFSQAWKV